MVSGFQFEAYLFMGKNLSLVKPYYVVDFEVQNDVQAEAYGDNYGGDG